MTTLNNEECWGNFGKDKFGWAKISNDLGKLGHTRGKPWTAVPPGFSPPRYLCHWAMARSDVVLTQPEGRRQNGVIRPFNIQTFINIQSLPRPLMLLLPTLGNVRSADAFEQAAACLSK